MSRRKSEIYLEIFLPNVVLIVNDDEHACGGRGINVWEGRLNSRALKDMSRRKSEIYLEIFLPNVVLIMNDDEHACGGRGINVREGRLNSRSLSLSFIYYIYLTYYIM